MVAVHVGKSTLILTELVYTIRSALQHADQHLVLLQQHCRWLEASIGPILIAHDHTATSSTTCFCVHA